MSWSQATNRYTLNHNTDHKPTKNTLHLLTELMYYAFTRSLVSTFTICSIKKIQQRNKNFQQNRLNRKI